MSRDAAVDNVSDGERRVGRSGVLSKVTGNRPARDRKIEKATGRVGHGSQHFVEVELEL